MFLFLKGKAEQEEEGVISIETGGIGYKVTVPTRIQKEIVKKGDAHLLTHTIVKEPSLDIYGFTTKADKKMFLSLIKVSGIGPKKAMQILNTVDGETLSQAIIQEDIETLALYGVAKKSAQKIILEIQKEIKHLSKEENTTIVDILVSLGYSKKIAQEGSRGIQDKEQPVSLQIQHALKHIKNK